ncbi:hypothetical protein STEG23_031516 [Scotinomys teguina]
MRVPCAPLCHPIPQTKISPFLPLAFPNCISGPCRVASDSREHLSYWSEDWGAELGCAEQQCLLAPYPVSSQGQRDSGQYLKKAVAVETVARTVHSMGQKDQSKEFLCDQKYSDEENLPEKLAAFKEKYMEFDLNNEGEIDLMSLKRMMEKLGVPKTHLEMKKMISEVTGGVSDTISYRDFVNMMLGKRSAVLKLVMMFEGKANESSPKPAGPPPERDIASLP